MTKIRIYKNSESIHKYEESVTSVTQLANSVMGSPLKFRR